MNFRTKSPELVPRAVFSSEIPCLSAGCVLGDVSRKKEKNGVRCAGCGRMLFSRHAARRSPQDAGAARATGDVPAQGLAERQAACRKARSERDGTARAIRKVSRSARDLRPNSSAGVRSHIRRGCRPNGQPLCRPEGAGLWGMAVLNIIIILHE